MTSIAPLLLRSPAGITTAQKPRLENYHARAAVQIARGRWLERLLPEEFEEETHPFQKELEALETRMEALAAGDQGVCVTGSRIPPRNALHSV
jgi:hypothetical protein